MNKPNNKKRKESQEKIEKIFIELLQYKDLTQISVTDICKLTNLNRSTFYANYMDIYDLADRVRDRLENEVMALYADEIKNKYNSNNFLKLFYHIKENQSFYKTYFKLGYDNQISIFKYDTHLSKVFYNDQFINYHIEFFKNGLNSIIRLWLKNGCKESPEEIDSILKSEYSHRHNLNKKR